MRGRRAASHAETRRRRDYGCRGGARARRDAQGVLPRLGPGAAGGGSWSSGCSSGGTPLAGGEANCVPPVQKAQTESLPAVSRCRLCIAIPSWVASTNAASNMATAWNAAVNDLSDMPATESSCRRKSPRGRHLTFAAHRRRREFGRQAGSAKLSAAMSTPAAGIIELGHGACGYRPAAPVLVVDELIVYRGRNTNSATGSSSCHARRHPPVVPV